MKHELLRLYLRISIFLLRRLNLYDDDDFWYESLNLDGLPSDEEVALARDVFLAETTQIIFNAIFDTGLMPQVATLADAREALESLGKVSPDPRDPDSGLAWGETGSKSLDKSR